MNNTYNKFADYYDEYSNAYDYEQWYKRLVALSCLETVEHKKVLDLGCGTGSMLLHFAVDKADIVGVDLSEVMLSYADQKLYKAKKRAILTKADMSRYCIDRKFDFIYSCCDSLNYLTKEDMQRLVKNVSRMLKDGAVFAFDLINPSYEFNEDMVDRFGEGHFTIELRRKCIGENLETEIVIMDEGETQTETHTQYLHSIDFIEELIRQNNLTLLSVGSFDNTEVGNENARKLQFQVVK